MIKRVFPIFLFLFFCHSQQMLAETTDDILKAKMALYKKTEAVTQVPWYYLAAINQYEKNIQKNADTEKLVFITIPEEQWFGIANPSKNTNSNIIGLFEGIGKDGNGDQQADPTDDEDVLYSMANLIAKQGTSKQDIKIALWDYYQRALTVQSISQIAKVYQTFETINLLDSDFPIPLHHNYSYRNTWGDARGFGGRRIHEGTDIFANYGTPVKATRYGVVEIMGWNRFGGWRIGIRDIYSNYHYYAHLNGFSDDLKVGDVVKPGDVIASVGATGYGPPGTSGKFPPHLHYGMYKDNGYSEWSFDPYPYLRRWEKEARK
ncbi:L-Ala--D-Glu endopeptidase [Paraliobacillus quinghaiensis]|uniref:L-Ala--D-Glu endopeptidase n=1 Tax=Paraliobacillus quinghaiensis TaxID=470815 RepID=A0A917TTD8_9BACI|nr:M23 family metallopeptidase [Paraliobacillus quinghaiensis]GGM37306.1 L-Ala--D-Glu endopeptidase [Paraliobacillus quinghaiensis]